MKKVLITWFLCSCFFISPLALLSSPKDKIVVIGSEPECITAAVTASKLGYDVTLVTSSDSLGGLFIDGMLTVLDINFDDNNKVLHNGFFKEFLNACSNGYNIDFKKTETFFSQIVKDYSVRVVYKAELIKPIVKNNAVIGVNYKQNEKKENIYCKFVVDGSSEASFARKLGVSYKKGRSEFGKPNSAAAASLIFSVKGANWEQITSYLANDNNPSTSYAKNAAWGFNTMYKCPIAHPNLQMRGLNLSKQNDGSVIINALLIFNVDSSNPKSINESYLLAKNELPSIISYLSKHCPGFENASLSKAARTLYIREGVRIIGIDTLSGNDVFEHLDFPNTIAYGSYPIDLQAAQKGDYGSALCGKCLYSIPLGCMLPKNISNVLVIGRSASFDIIAHGSARTVPILMSMAENGVAAIDYSIKNNISLNVLNKSPKHLSLFYKELNKFNGFEKLILPKNNLNNQWYYPYIHDLMSKGYLSLGYSNHDLDSIEHTKEALSSTLTLLTSNSSFKLSKTCKNFIHPLKQRITHDDLCKVLSYIFEDHFSTLQDLFHEGIIDETTYMHTNNTSFLSHAELYAIIDCALKRINPNTPITIYTDSLEIVQE